ncbi:MAG TPA: AAA family ATPase [Candidatus Paceibacterota bacterium]|nr:AAA family ATPase [Candidatus Paceibacterota bacterium]
MPRPKLIILNGFAGVGKTTLAKRYIDEHPLALDIEGDRLIVMLGQWLAHEDEARKIIFELTKSLAGTHLGLGRDVVITYLLTDATHAEAFEQLAQEHSADYKEVFLAADRDEAIARLLKRGTWGEEGLDPLTEEDLPSINKLWDTMATETAKRPSSITVPVKEGDIDHTYQLFITALEG